MKHVRFYQEFTNKRKGISAGNVVAALVGNGFQTGWPLRYDAICALWMEANSPVCGSSVSLDYLRKVCKRVSERKARQIHPRLFNSGLL